MNMRAGLALIMSLGALVMGSSAAFAAEPINGRWVTAERDAIVEIKKCGGVTCGRIAQFLVTPPGGADQRDINNPDANLRKRKLLGLPILTQFRTDGDEWRGQIYDPNRGRTFRSIIRRTDAGTLEVKGCFGPLCQTQIWKKAP